MYYPERRHERRDYKWQPALRYHERSRGAQESQTGAGTPRNGTKTATKQPTSAVLILKCLLFLSVCLIRLHIVCVWGGVAMEAPLAAGTEVICDVLGFGSDGHKQSLENLELPNCQSA